MVCIGSERRATGRRVGDVVDTARSRVLWPSRELSSSSSSSSNNNIQQHSRKTRFEQHAYAPFILNHVWQGYCSCCISLSCDQLFFTSFDSDSSSENDFLICFTKKTGCYFESTRRAGRSYSVRYFYFNCSMSCGGCEFRRNE